MKTPSDGGGNPTIQIDVVDLDEVKLEALAASERARSIPAGPPPLPPSALVSQMPSPSATVAPAPPRRGNILLVVALVVCVGVSFAIVALVRKANPPLAAPAAQTAASAQAAPPAKPAPTVLTIPTVDMTDEAPRGAASK